MWLLWSKQIAGYTRNFWRRLLVQSQNHCHLSATMKKELKKYNAGLGVILCCCTKRLMDVLWIYPSGRRIRILVWLTVGTKSTHWERLTFQSTFMASAGDLDSVCLGQSPKRNGLEVLQNCKLIQTTGGSEGDLIHCICEGKLCYTWKEKLYLVRQKLSQPHQGSTAWKEMAVRLT